MFHAAPAINPYVKVLPVYRYRKGVNIAATITDVLIDLLIMSFSIFYLLLLAFFIIAMVCLMLATKPRHTNKIINHGAVPNLLSM